ncbi:MAG TPA: RNA repair domain-containing protein [Methanomassiliicoccales archaeon]|nr:RNA repair domain-containing protein [Methanomassiliicoccales archaeon]
MVFPREVLNELRWHPTRSFDRAEITYEHRGAPGDIRVISGSDIMELGRSFFGTGESRIPYHRIRKIRLLDDKGETDKIWEFSP